MAMVGLDCLDYGDCTPPPLIKEMASHITALAKNIHDARAEFSSVAS